MANYVITTSGSAFEFETTLMAYPTRPFAIDTNHFFVCYQGAGSDGFASVFAVNTSTWAVSEAGTIEHDTQNDTWNSCVQIDTNHFAVWYLGSATTTDGFVQVFTVNTSTWAITTASSRFLFNTDVGSHNSALMIDTNHVINFWAGAAGDGFAQVFTIDTTTWAVTTAGSSLEFDTTDATYNSALKVDDNHFINFWAGVDADGFVQVFTVNTTTWAVTTANSSLEFDTQNGTWNSSFKVDTNHFINFWAGAGADGFAQVFTVNTSTWAVTTAASSLEFDTQQLANNSQYAVSQVDDNHFLYLWSGPDTGASTAYDGFAQVFEVNTTTWAITTSGASFEFDATQGEYNAISPKIAGTTDKYLAVWSGSGDDGYAQVLEANATPTVTLDSPADAGSTSDTTPTLTFTGTDPEGEDITYNIVIGTDDNLDSVAYDSSSSNATTSTNTNSYSHTFPSTIADGLLVVFINGYSSSNQVRVSTCTYNSVSLTQRATIYKDSLLSGNRGWEVWTIATPATGANTLAVTMTNSLDNISVHAVNIKNANPTLDATNTATEGDWVTPTTVDGPYEIGVTTTVDNCLVLTACASVDTGTLAPSAGQTQIASTVSGYVISSYSSSLKTPAGTVTHGYDNATNDYAYLIGVSVAPKGQILVNAVSNAGSGFAFINQDDGADLDPFTSGDQVGFTAKELIP